MSGEAAPQRSGLGAGLLRLARHAASPASLPKLIWKNIAFHFSAEGAERRYDRRLGIDTAGYIETADLDLDAGAIERGMPYGATPPNVARYFIEAVAARARGFTFVDVGSGKGRVLLIAAQYPFCKVVGFEHSKILAEVAAANIRRFTGACVAPIEILTGDAAVLPLPDGPLVLFLFNSLPAGAVREFAASVKSSYLRHPRKIILIYYNSACPDAFGETGIFSAGQSMDYPDDPCDRYRKLKFPAVVFETRD